MSARRGDWMQTASGVAFWPLDPRAEEVRIEDIAHSLSMQCRFAGHCRSFYSVAEHSVRVSEHVEHLLAARLLGAAQEVPRTHPDVLRGALWGLLHDASEAYLVDVPRPVKPHLGGYREAEERVMAAVCARFGLPLAPPPEVKEADNVLLATEARDLMGPPPQPWAPMPEPLPGVIKPWAPAEARDLFLRRFRRLTAALEAAR